MPKYTEEQIQKAKDIDVRTFLEQTEGYTFKQSGRYLKCENPEHTGQPSSLAIDTRMNRIFYNSVTGNRPLSAVDWCTIVNKMDFQSAMRLVLGENPQGERVAAPKFEPHRPVKNEEEKKEFHIPEKSPTISRLYAYLTKSRGISSHIVNDCINKGIVFQDQRNNAVFAGFDDDGNMKYAARRGTLTIEGVEPFKRDVAGSDKKFAFKMVGNNTDTIYVTEAAIDAMSLASLEDKFNGLGAFKNKTYISTGGAGMDKAIEQFCKTHDVKTINICFDNDEAGKNGMEKIMDKFRSLGYEVNDMRASLAHDYNDELIASNNNPDFYPEPPVTVSMPKKEINERNDIAMQNFDSPTADESTYTDTLSAQKQTEHIKEQVTQQDIHEQVPEEYEYYEPSFEEMAELWGEPVQNNYYDIETENLQEQQKQKGNQAERNEDVIQNSNYEQSIMENTQSPESERNDYIMQYDDSIPPMMSSNEHYEPTPEEMAEVFGNPVSNNTQPITEAPTQNNNERNDVTMPNSMSPKQKPVEKQDQATPKQNNQQEQSSQNQRSATVVGNTPYKSIPDKVHMRVDHSLTLNLANRLQEENISYSGRMDKNELVFAVSNKDKDRVSDIIKQEQEALRKKEEPEIPVQPIEPKSSLSENPKTQSAQITQSSEPTAVKQDTPELTAETLEDKQPCERANSLLSSLREHHEKRRSDLQDKIEKINLKIQTRTDRIDKLNNKVKNLESTIKSFNAFTAVVKPDSVLLGKLANFMAENKERKLQMINDVKIPKHKDKIAHQKDKLAKAQIKLAKVERKIDKIDKVQNFLSSITSKDRDIRHKGFITGMENLTEVRAENLVSKMEKTSAKMEKLNAEYNQPDKSHRERYEIKQKYNDLSAKFKNMENKFEQYKGVSEKLKNMNDSQIDSSLEKTIAKLNERIEKMESNEKGLINTIVEHSVEAGTEAINEVTQDKSLDRVNPEITHERVPNERMSVTEAKEQQILNAIAVATGIDISEMNRLPDEIKADIITEFQENSGNISSEKLTERICEIADIKLPENIKQPETIPEQDKKEEKENPLHHIEEIMEENPNYTNDGLLNNLPPEKENTRKNEKELSSDEPIKHDEKLKAETDSKDKPLFSREKIMSEEKYRPISSKSQEDIQRDKEKNRNKGVSL